MSAIESMRSDLRWVDIHRKRASALDGLGILLECETPGTVSEVSVKRGRWFLRSLASRNQDDDGKREIILSTDERREFAAWCKERAEKLRKRADEIEVRLVTKETP